MQSRARICLLLDVEHSRITSPANVIGLFSKIVRIGGGPSVARPRHAVSTFNGGFAEFASANLAGFVATAVVLVIALLLVRLELV